MIEAGEYVRTDDGRIIKIDGSWKYSTNNKGTILFIHITQIPVSYYTKKITKHSKNIIDIVELYDYVNGFIVFDIKTRDNGEKAIQLMHGVLLEQDEIDSIVTHEQFEAMKYKVEE